MRLNIEALTGLSDSHAGVVAVAVTKPFDRSAADLPFAEEAAKQLVAEANRTGFEADLGQTVYVYAPHGEARWIALIGAGASPKATDYRRVGSALVALGKSLKEATGALLGANSAARVRYATEGAFLKGYAFDAYKKKDPAADKTPTFRCVEIVADDAHLAGVQTGIDIAQSVAFARDLSNEHPGKCVPEWMAEQAQEIATRHSLSCNIRYDEQLEKEGFHLIRAVGKGSANKPVLIHLVYKPQGEVKKRVALVGKGVTYDSGGYSMKPSASQVNMHLDMGGSAAVLGAAEAIGRTKPEGVEVHFIVPSAENMVSSDAYKVMEVVTGYAGISVEVLNTDAEGRLILADALAYAVEQEPDEIIDLATLTGACVVALGHETAGVWSNDDAFAKRFVEAADEVDESVWHMPLTDRIRDQLKSSIADTKNVGTRWGGAISAALFLEKFVSERTWLHIDIAGTAMADAEWEYINKGGTGFGVIALHEYCRRQGE